MSETGWHENIFPDKTEKPVCQFSPFCWGLYTPVNTMLHAGQNKHHTWFDNKSWESVPQWGKCWVTGTNDTSACETLLVYSHDCETWAETSMRRLFDVHLLWIQEVTLYFYVISAAGAKPVLQRVVGTSDVWTIMFTCPPTPHPKCSLKTRLTYLSNYWL